MSVLHPRLHRRSLNVAVTLVLLVAAVLTLIHWHADSAGQRCEICFARHLPSIPVPFVGAVAVPTRIEWLSQVKKPEALRTASFESKTSRAPPLNPFL
jgi:hypothetical protein